MIPQARASYSLLLLLLGVLFVAALPDLQRYLRIREM